MAEPTTPQLPSELPVLPLRRTVAFPLTLQPLAVNRPVSIESVNRALGADRLVLLVLQENDEDDPGPDDMRKVGTVGMIRQMAKVSSGINIIIEGVARVRADVITRTGTSMRAQITPMPETVERTLEVCKEVLSARGLGPDQVDEILLVGGQSRMPLVSRRVREVFGREPNHGAHPDEAKIRLLGVRAETLRQYGAVSAETAAEMAEGARRESGADIAASITGIAGPTGGTTEKPVGLVWFGISTARGTETHKLKFPGERDLIRQFSAMRLLDFVRRRILSENPKLAACG
jgi:PncC family amidohydrolase